MRLIRDTTAEADSNRVRFLGHHPLHSTLVISAYREGSIYHVMSDDLRFWMALSILMSAGSSWA